MQSFARLRSDGALSIDLEKMADASPISETTEREQQRQLQQYGKIATAPAAAAAAAATADCDFSSELRGICRRQGDFPFFGAADSVSPYPRRPSSVVTAEDFDAQEHVTQEEGRRLPQESTSQEVVDASPRHVTFVSSAGNLKEGSPQPQRSNDDDDGDHQRVQHDTLDRPCRANGGENRMQEEQEMMISPRGRRNAGKPTRLSQDERKELFERLAMPVRKSEEKKGETYLARDEMKKREKDKEGEGLQRCVFQWPVPSIPTLTLVDLERHNKLANYMRS
ncbi:hypothetical protein TcCL_ESM01406 [Trypanosoma cruzi]|uniref:Uncharacterized protein n=1 Tax=Trypanosoma cruzi (strain CL Brener) TaxID=353153 RepID=Q4CTH5_TRYCC|nr:hypothetical protein Tc00.1047053508213.30 [Trypanosoma cruzi]EAN83576.1 hypothetical protein Tc00.1047053508213.30 [Trypanosoma cruzi]RNC60944.1 hypothetical protein TcCL_ESM01406 [Trypanosoma cruzi]|eukprot:XP_805427.1 hypothetical protein [Trypanosoma cruzi strain CL Brener]